MVLILGVLIFEAVILARPNWWGLILSALEQDKPVANCVYRLWLLERLL
ncbi:hypothetical protein [Nodosilinea sp. LEGE 06152]|nr:hypothetical protein [Nodosilinea sp. LEGE 06152]